MPVDELTQPVPVATKRDYRKEVTDSIVDMLEKGVAPWQKPWTAGALEMPSNPVTGRVYRGGNALYLITTAATRGYDDPRWITYKQASERGWQVRKGEKGAPIEYWEFPKRQSADLDDDAAPAKSESGRSERLIHRVYTVFNAKQVDGMPPHTPKQQPEFAVIQAGESILEHSGARIQHDQNDRAFYSRGRDSIHLPPLAAFKTAPDYYGTALHELAHWTGHPSRLNRSTLNESYSFGDLNYAQEELRAELASVFLAAERGIPHDPANHAAYVGSWLKALRGDKNEIFRAAKDAHRATDFLLALEVHKSVDQALASIDNPQIRRETSEYVAEYEPGSGTVDIEQKRNGAEHRSPVDGGPGAREEAEQIEEQILDKQQRGSSRADGGALKRSFAEAQELTKGNLGAQARTFVAQTDSGKYRGEILGETSLHLVQQVSSQSSVAHMKSLLSTIPKAGESVLVAYSNDKAAVRPFQQRTRSKELTR
jgi:antirestriction protein ArdC